MPKQLPASSFYKLPSGIEVHPWRLIHRDGTIMWKQALLQPDGSVHIPIDQSHEAHIVKTAQRIEELNCWVSQTLEPWECLTPVVWYSINHKHEPFANGYACCFKHTTVPSQHVLTVLKPHIQSHEQLEYQDNTIYFRRC